MKKKYIRSLSILLTVVMLIGLLPISALADETSETDSDVDYQQLYTTAAVTGGVEITGFNADYVSTLSTDEDHGHIHIDLVIPETIEGQPVVSIRKNAFSGENSVGLPKQSLPDTLRITSIDLSGATNLTTIGEKAFLYGGSTFYYDELSGGLTFPDSGSLKTIGEGAFYYQGKLTGDLKFPDSVETIGAQAFQNAGFDGTLTLPNNDQFTEVASQAFMYTHFKDITGLTTNGQLPRNLQVLGKYAFEGTDITGDIVLPDTITTLWNAFEDTGITSLYVPSSVTKINPDFVRNCKNLKWAKLDFDFKGVDSLITEVDDWAMLTSINDEAIIIMNGKESYDNAHTDAITSKFQLGQLTYPVTLKFYGLDKSYNVDVLYNQPINRQRSTEDSTKWNYSENTNWNYTVDANYVLPDQPAGSIQYPAWSFEKDGDSAVTETSPVTGDTLYTIEAPPKLTVTYSGNINAVYDGQPKVFTATASINAPYKLKLYTETSEDLEEGDYCVAYFWYARSIHSSTSVLCEYDGLQSYMSFTDVAESRTGFEFYQVYAYLCRVTNGVARVIDSDTKQFNVNITPATPTVSLTPGGVPAGTAVGDIPFALGDGSTEGTLTIKTADETVIEAGEQSITYDFTPTDTENYLTLTDASATITGITDTVTITPESIKAYVGGSSINGSHMPKLRYSVKTPENVELGDLEFTLNTVTKKEDGTEKVESKELDPVTINEDNSYTTYCLFPQLTANMNGETNSVEGASDTAVQRGDYLKLVDADHNSETYAGVYYLEKRTGENAAWSDWYITAKDKKTGFVYQVDLVTEKTVTDENGDPVIDEDGNTKTEPIAAITILEISNEKDMYDEVDNGKDSTHYLTTVQEAGTAVEDVSEEEAAAGQGFIAVADEETTFKTNGEDALGVLAYETNEDGSVKKGTIETKNTTDADIALLVDDLIIAGTDYATDPDKTVKDLKNDMIDLAQKQAADTESDLNLEVPFKTNNYQFKYLDLVNASDGNAVMETTDQDTVTIYWPYPEGITYYDGIEKDYSFQILHYVGMDRSYTVDADNTDPLTDESGKEIQVESLEVTATANGLKFRTDSFSPFVLLWEKKQSETVQPTRTRYTLTVDYVCASGDTEGKPGTFTISGYTGTTVSIADIEGKLPTWTDHTYANTLAYDPDMTKTIDRDTTSITLTGNLTIYAGFLELGGNIGAVGDHTLTYESGGGTTYEPEAYGQGTQVTLDKLPVREGYTFTGWYADESLSQKVETVTMDTDITVWAGWKVSTVPALLNGDSHFAYIVGYGDNTVRPGNNITRAEVATIFFRLLKDETRDGNLTSENPYEDVPENAWYCKAVSTLTALGILEGRSETIFAPNAPITRAEMATICARFDTSEISGGSTFTDISGHWAEAEIQRAAALGWIEGYEDGTFRPNKNITRAEAITMINRVLRRIPTEESDLLEDMNTWTDNSSTDAWYYLAIQEATNSHDFQQKGEVSETWTQLQEDPDWEKYEK